MGDQAGYNAFQKGEIALGGGGGSMVLLREYGNLQT